MEENSGTAGEFGAVETAAPCNLFEAPSFVQVDGCEVARVDDVPRVGGPLPNPLESSSRESVGDTLPAMTGRNCDPTQVVARAGRPVATRPVVCFGPSNDDVVDKGDEQLPIGVVQDPVE